MTSEYVRIPPEKNDLVQGQDCVRWLVNETHAGVQGHVIDGQFFLRFDDAAEAKRFRDQWLTSVR